MTERRAFIRGLVLSASGVAIAGCSSPGQTSSDSGSDGGGGSSDGDGGSESSSSDGGSSDGSSGEWVQTSTVEMTDGLKYDPKQIEVSAGTTVTFENIGSIGHTVTAYEDKIPDGASYFASGGYDSEQAAKDAYSNEKGGNVPKGESYEVTLDTTGTYEYYCIPHEMNAMVGKIKVV